MSIKQKLLQFFTLILTRWLKATEPQKLSINFLKLPGKDWKKGYPNKIQTKEKSLVKVTLFLSPNVYKKEETKSEPIK